MKPSRLALVVVFAACSSSQSPTPAPPPGAPATTATAAPTAPVSPSSVETRTFASTALGVDKTYVVYLPAGYASSPDRRYPVLYMLHGLAGSEVNWRELGIAEAADAVGLEAIIVMPDGDDGFYVNWAEPANYDACLTSKRAFGKEADMRTYCVKQGNYEDYIASDLRTEIETHFRTVPGREGRAIGGLSMGGYGALYLAMRRPSLYGAVASHAGWAAIRYKSEQAYEKGKTELVEDPAPRLAEAGAFGPMLQRVFGTSAENWKAHDPATLAANLSPGQLAIYLDCGTEDEFQFHNHNQYLSEVLTEHGLAHDFHLIEGGHHNGDFWRSRIDDSLTFVDKFFRSER